MVTNSVSGTCKAVDFDKVSTRTSVIKTARSNEKGRNKTWQITGRQRPRNRKTNRWETEIRWQNMSHVSTQGRTRRKGWRLKQNILLKTCAIALIIRTCRIPWFGIRKKTYEYNCQRCVSPVEKYHNDVQSILIFALHPGTQKKDIKIALYLIGKPVHNAWNKV